jgi:hypothetical protein
MIPSTYDIFFSTKNTEFLNIPCMDLKKKNEKKNNSSRAYRTQGVGPSIAVVWPQPSEADSTGASA